MQIVNLLFTVVFASVALVPVAAEHSLRVVVPLDEPGAPVEPAHMEQSTDPMKPPPKEPAASVDPATLPVGLAAPPLVPLAPAQAGSCGLYPGCVAANVTGQCCPTIENVTLDCCAAKETTGITETNCQNIPACQKLNLTGSCCATIDAVTLDCCKDSARMCELIPACAKLNLTGNCCDTIDGVTLDCCKA